MSTPTTRITEKERAAWLSDLRVGDKMAWMQYGCVRSVHTILRETPKCFVINEDGWLVSKHTGYSKNHISLVRFDPYEKGMEALIAHQLRIAEREYERKELLARISRFSLKRLRAIAEVGAT